MAHSRQFICIPSAKTLSHSGYFHPTPEDAWRAEGSDFLPSVSLAVVLILIFISVLPVLLQPNTGYITLRKLSDVNGRAVQFHPLLYTQPLSTQMMVRRLIKNGDEGWMVVAVAEDAPRTLECFSTNVMAILSNQLQPFVKQVRDHKPSEAFDHITKAAQVFSVAVITGTKGQIPHGVILGPLSLVTGNLHLVEIKLQGSPTNEHSTALMESLSIAGGLLHHLYKPKPIPDTFKIKNSTRQQFEVIEIKGDPYLESGCVC